MIKTTALLLKSCKYKEKDKLLTFFTEDLGKVTALCKSSRTVNHRWGCSTEPPVYAFIQLYEKNTFYTLTEMLAVESLLGSRQKLDHLMSYQYLSMILDRYTPCGVPHQELFLKAQTVFFQWKNPAISPFPGLYQFLVFFLSTQGYAQSWSHCSTCGRSLLDASEEQYYCNLSEGLLLCGACLRLKSDLTPVRRSTCLLFNALLEGSCNLPKEEEKCSHLPWLEMDNLVAMVFKKNLDQYFVSFNQYYASIGGWL